MTGKARYRAVFTPVGWQVIDRWEACDPIAEYGLGRDEYARALARAASLNQKHDCNDHMHEMPGYGWDCARCWGQE